MDAVACEFYLGTALVPLRNLSYLESETHGDSCTGCCVNDVYHNLPTLIRALDLQALLDGSGTDSRSLYHVVDYPKLACPESMQLSCLHGEFRLRTARANANAPSEWWTVDLYTVEMPFGVSNYIRQLYRKHNPLCDGEIYLRVRYYQRRNALEDSTAWLSKLSESKQKNVKQIWRNKHLMRSLDRLEPFRGLWSNFHISCFPPILSWRCYEEVESYLSYMITTWETLTQGDANLCDPLTVENLQGLAPTWSSIDHDKIKTLFASHKIFPKVEESSRDSILRGLLNVSDFVPSFATFSKHTKVIRSSMLALRQLVPTQVRCSLRAAFQDCYKMRHVQGSSCIIQYSEEEEKQIPMDPEKATDLAYVQLFLASLRDKRNIPERLSVINPGSSGWLIRLAHTAEHLGFETDVILRLRNCNADISDIRQNMKRERPKALYSVSEANFDEEAQLRHHRQSIYERRPHSMRESMTDASISTRGARNYHNLYLPLISQALASKAMGPALTSFGELVLALSAFFVSMGSNVAVAQDCISEPALDAEHGQEHRHGDVLIAQTSTKMPQDSIVAPAMINFISMDLSPTIGPIVSCPGTESEIERTLEKIASTGSKTFLVPQIFENPFSTLQILFASPRYLVQLNRKEPGLKIFFCGKADTDGYVGKPLKDFSHVHKLAKAPDTLGS